MKIIGKVIRIHKGLFVATLILSIVSVFVTLFWNAVLANLINYFGNITVSQEKLLSNPIFNLFVGLIIIMLLNTLCEYISNYLAAYTCETFAHEMRVGYARFYLKTDIRKLAKMNVGEEQSAMQNEMKEISLYLKDNLISLIKQFIAFIVTTVFLLCQSCKLALATILPVLPLIVYCFISGKVIKQYTGRCLECKQEINGLTGTILELFPIIQVYNGYKLISDAMDSSLDVWEEHNIKKERISAKLMTLSGVLSFVPLLILLCVGGNMVVSGEISIGLFYIFINLSGNVSGFLQNMPNIYAGFRQFGASVDRIGEKLVLKEDR